MTGMDLFRFELGEIKDAGKIQTANGKGLEGESFTELHRIGFHGFGYNPPKGSHAVGMSMHGRRDRALILGLEHADKRQKNIPSGASVLYDSSGNVLRMFNDHVLLDAQTNPVTIRTTDFKIEVGGVTVHITPGGISVTGGTIKHDGKSIDKTHVHGGIVPGGADTDVPSN